MNAFANAPGVKQKTESRQAAGGNAYARINKDNPSASFTNCACGGGCPACQKKSRDIEISQPADAAEIEADQIADKVMRIPARETTPAVSRKNSADTIQRKCSTCEDEEEIIQRKPASSGNAMPSQSPAHVSNAVSSGGRPLDNKTRNFFESRMGYDLGSIRIHTGSTAEQSALKINARAYAAGRDIVFGSGEYNPETTSGKKLIAHELAHTIQQAQSTVKIQRKSFDDKDKIHGPIEDQFCLETGNCEEGARHGAEYAEWITALEDLDNFKITVRHLRLSRVIQKFEQMSLEELHEYRLNYIASESDPPGEYPHDPAVVKYLTDLMMSRPVQKCTKAEAEKAEKSGQQALMDAVPMVNEALSAITLLLSAWSGNKQSLIARTATLTGEVACAFRSNFNINESDANWGVTAIKVESKLLWLSKRLKSPVSFACEPINSKVCLESAGRDAEAYVVNHTGPIHLCYGFRNSVFDPASTIIHEMLHFRSGLGDAGGYAKLSTSAMTCRPGIQFTAAPDVLTNTADAITGFIMHIHNTSASDLQVVRAPVP